ncbi:MAG TPA: radical SAM protein [Methanocella sp.]|nr:radical SAM protein [Methanocella sp.]
MKYREIRCKTALSRSGLAGLDYSLNPYTGCEHSCIYCYAPSTIFYRGDDPWGTFVQAKSNIPIILEKESRKVRKGVVGISTVTDPYQPLEGKLRLTRSCLKVLLAKGFPVCVQTKSALVLRDIDLLVEFSVKEVGFTITTLDDQLSAFLEPGSSPASERLAALRELSSKGIPTWAFIGPMIPGIITEELLTGLLEDLKDAGVSHVMIDRLRLKPGMWDVLNQKLAAIPEARELCGKALLDGGRTFNALKEKAVRLCQEIDLACQPNY